MWDSNKCDNYKETKNFDNIVGRNDTENVK